MNVELNELYETVVRRKEGGPGSGVKGHTTAKEPKASKGVDSKHLSPSAPTKGYDKIEKGISEQEAKKYIDIALQHSDSVEDYGLKIVKRGDKYDVYEPEDPGDNDEGKFFKK